MPASHATMLDAGFRLIGVLKTASVRELRILAAEHGLPMAALSYRRIGPVYHAYAPVGRLA